MGFWQKENPRSICQRVRKGRGCEAIHGPRTYLGAKSGVNEAKTIARSIKRTAKARSKVAITDQAPAGRTALLRSQKHELQGARKHEHRLNIGSEIQENPMRIARNCCIGPCLVRDAAAVARPIGFGSRCWNGDGCEWSSHFRSNPHLHRE